MRLKYFNFDEAIKKYNNIVPKGDFNNKINNKIASDSWFDITNKNTLSIKSINKSSFDIDHSPCNEYFSIKKIYLLPDKKQKELLLLMMEGYRKMYNIGLKKIKTTKQFNFYKLRTSLKLDKKKINKIYKTPTHCLDDAIKLILSNYKSALTNLRNKNISHFKINFWKEGKQNKILGVEQIYFKKNHIFKNLLKDQLKNTSNFEYDKISCDSKIIYYGNQDRFVLLIPIKTVVEKPHNKNNFIGIDLGLRTFISGLSKNKSYEIGTNCCGNIVKDFNKIKKIGLEKKIPNKIKEKKINKINQKLMNKIDDLHWKSIKFITSNFSTVVIGKLSTKGITKKDGVLSKEQRRICYKLKYYQYLQRLENKCNLKKIKIKIIDESYTSKTCSNCGFVKKNLGGNKVYNCNKCKYLDDRDLNACRNIIYKTLI